MTPTEVIESLAALGPQDFSVVLQFLADHVYGAHLRDSTDFKRWLEQLAIAAHARRAGLAETTRKPVAALPERKRSA